MGNRKVINKDKAVALVKNYREDWNAFARDAFGARLDPEQQEILHAVQTQPRVSVASGTSRGKDFLAACASLCFMYLTPVWNAADPRQMIRNTKVLMTAPTDRQVGNIMHPEVMRLWKNAHRRGFNLAGRPTGYDIRTQWEEWYLTGFKADQYNTEAWTGLHAANIMFVVTEATGLPELVYDAILGNLQGNSRLFIVFNPNTTVGYAARTQRSPRWTKFRLSSLTAPNVVAKKEIITGQVDYAWIQGMLEEHAQPITQEEVTAEEDDFEFEGQWYRPDDLFRIKVLGKFPKVDSSSLIPSQWIELANERWKNYHHKSYSSKLRLGVDVAGMGRDATVEVYRFDNIVREIRSVNSGGRADHMATAGRIVNVLRGYPQAVALIDTIGEGAGVYSRVAEEGYADGGFGLVDTETHDRAISAKFSHVDKSLTDMTGELTFANLRAYCYWSLREWLDPKNGHEAMLPANDRLFNQLVEIKWNFQGNGSIIIEPKEKIQERIGHSPDEADALAITFYPVPHNHTITLTKENLGLY